jgi:tRNA(Arg) A34 adenosine deaminase TadA
LVFTEKGHDPWNGDKAAGSRPGAGCSWAGWRSSVPPRRWRRANGDAGDIAQPEVADPAHFMARAQAMRALAIETGDQAYGAVVVRDGRIVGQAPSRVVVNRDPTAHAETEAIRDAARRLGTADLSGCRLYSTSRACQMCETAAYWAQIDALVHGAAMESAGRPQYRRC